jgi:hypothetical protein
MFLQQSASLNLSGIFLLHVVEFTLGPEIKLLPDNSWKLPALSHSVLWIRCLSDPKLLAGSGKSPLILIRAASDPK